MTRNPLLVHTRVLPGSSQPWLDAQKFPFVLRFKGNFATWHGLALIQEWGRVVQGSALAHLGRLTKGVEEIKPA